MQSLAQKTASKTPLIVGLAESGILLSGLMHQIAEEQGVEAHWICSTRRKAMGIQFTESHSHGPDHILPLPDCQPTEIWFVEDEITTGKTVFYLAVKLCSLFKISQIRLFTLADSRTREETARFHIALAYHEIRCCTETVVHIEKRNTQVDLLPYASSHLDLKVARQFCQPSNEWHIPTTRPAVQAQRNSTVDGSAQLQGCLLVIGEAIDLALKFVQENSSLSFQQITLSPWKIDNTSVLSCLEIGERYHLYNYERLKPPIYILSDPVDYAIEQSARASLIQKGVVVESLSLSSHFT
jgi:Phosphoribosyl transferase